MLLLFRHEAVSNCMLPHRLQHARLPCPLPSPRVCSNSSSLSWWCHPTISSSVVPFSSCLQSFPASGSFPMSSPFASVGQSIEVSALASALPMYFQDWFPLGMTEGLVMCGSETHVISCHLNSTFGFIAFQLQEELILDDIYTSSCRITDLMISSPKMVVLLGVTFAFLMHFH